MFPHTDQALSRVFRGGKMQMGEFRHRMAKRFVDAAGDLSTLNMSHRDVHVGADHGRGKIGSDIESRQNDVRAKTLEQIDQPGKHPTDGPGHLCPCVRRLSQKHRDRRFNGKAVPLDHVDITSVLRHQGNAGDNELVVEIWVLPDQLKNRLKPAIIRSSFGNNGNGTHHATSLHLI